jgi:FemAB-related protein (PEP-CTERM system-associated)
VTFPLAAPPAVRSISVGRVDDAAWDAYVDGHPSRSAYHYAGWPRLIARAFRHDVELLAATEGGRVAGVLPLVVMRSRVFGRFVVSLPFLNEGGLLADDEDVEKRLIAEAIEVARGAGAEYLELRHRRRHSPELRDRSHKVAMTLALRGSADEQWQALDRKVRNQVRKAEKSGVVVTDGGTELLHSFYGVFARNMRDLGTPVFGASLFSESLRTFPERTRIFVAHHRESAVAGSLVHWRGDSIEVIWASALRESNSVCANILLYWHMLQFAISQRCTRFEFGRCTPGEGPFQFKKQWGAEPTPLVWEYWHQGCVVDVDKTPRNPKYRAAVAIWQRLPVGLTTLVGPRIVRSIPC